GSATDFNETDYYWLMGKAYEMDDILSNHSRIMDKYDPKKRVGLMVDEWGTWWNVEPGTNPGFLYQQNTMRDAMVAALTLNIFHDHADRVRMANIAQFANVLQAMVLTKDDKMVLTPTYYVFKSYIPHQGARHIPLECDAPILDVSKGRKVPEVTVTASEKDGVTTISLVNVSLADRQDVNIDLSGIKARKVTGEIITAADIHDYNDFDREEKVNIKPFRDARLKDGHLKVELPPHSIVTLSLTD
ncbi:MAG: alpha-N-arabinofuranosidase, partial [Duncaniella sp.]|nr:alpha-N-arabinofuranosidase [Duncaniella sp.]